METQFAYNEKVKVILGFYRGYYGNVTKHIKDDLYEVKIKINNDKSITEQLKGDMMQHAKSFKDLLNR